MASVSKKTPQPPAALLPTLDLIAQMLGDALLQDMEEQTTAHCDKEAAKNSGSTQIR